MPQNFFRRTAQSSLEAPSAPGAPQSAAECLQTASREPLSASRAPPERLQTASEASRFGRSLRAQTSQSAARAHTSLLQCVKQYKNGRAVSGAAPKLPGSTVMSNVLVVREAVL